MKGFTRAIEERDLSRPYGVLNWMKDNTSLIILLALVIAGAVMTQDFFTWDNINEFASITQRFNSFFQRKSLKE